MDQPHPSALPLPLPHHLGGRHQSLPLRLVGRPGAPLPLWRSGTAALLGSTLRAIARPNRSAGGDEPLRPPRPGGGLPAGQQTNADAGPGPWGSRGEPLSGRAGSGGKATLSRPQPRRLRQRGTAGGIPGPDTSARCRGPGALGAGHPPAASFSAIGSTAVARGPHDQRSGAAGAGGAGGGGRGPHLPQLRWPGDGRGGRAQR